MFPNSEVGMLDMEYSTRGGIINGVTPILILLLLGSAAAAQSPKAAQKTKDYVRNIELCNQADHASLQARIDGCTALIDTNEGATTALAGTLALAWISVQTDGARPC